MHIYKEGFCLELFGTRCRFAVWADDDDSEFIFKRKPKESTLNKIYEQSLRFDCFDYDNI